MAPLEKQKNEESIARKHAGGSVVLRLSGFGVAFGENIVLADVTLDVPSLGITVLMGPAGAGKSTLLRTLVGFNDPQPSLRTWGEVEFLGNAIAEENYPEMVIQKAALLSSDIRENLVSALPNRSDLSRSEQDELLKQRLREYGLDEFTDRLHDTANTLSLGDQRRLSVARALFKDPPLLMLDEPMATLDDISVEPLIQLLQDQALKRAILVVSHHQSRARRLGGNFSLLAGGRIIEKSTVKDFFDKPKTKRGEEFLQTGRCNVPSANAKPEDLAPDAEAPAPIPKAAKASPNRRQGPRGFYWLYAGKLGGCPRPGIVASLQTDINALKRIGATVLYTFEEKVHAKIPKDSGIFQIHFPIDDMKTPTLEKALIYCQDVDAAVKKGEVVVVHCRAGLGRTGTMLACQLVYDGQSAVDALNRARQINPKWIQSDEQISFLSEFQQFLEDNEGSSKDNSFPQGVNNLNVRTR